MSEAVKKESDSSPNPEKSTEDESETKEEELEVPLEKAGALIGAGGCVIESIRDESGAKVELPSRQERDELSKSGTTTANVTIEGTPASIAKAKELIREALEKPRGVEVTLGGIKFRRYEEIYRKCKEIADGANDGEPLSGSSMFVVYDLLRHHPKAEEKCGGGLASIVYGPSEEFPDTKCFYAVRADGSRDSFSFKKCIEAAIDDARAAKLQQQRGGGSGKRDRADGDPGGGAGSPAKFQKTEFVPGLVVVADGAGDAADYKVLRETFGKHGTVRYVEVHDGKVYVRFAEPEGASAAAAVGLTEIDGETVSLVLLEGDEEQKYWERLWAQQERRAAREAGGGFGRGGRRGRGRGGRGGRGGRRHRG